jgi:hypothetical protein
MNADVVTRLFKDAYNTFPLLEGKPTYDALLATREILLFFRDKGGGWGQHLVAAAAAAMAAEGRDVPVGENFMECLFYFFLCVNFFSVVLK